MAFQNSITADKLTVELNDSTSPWQLSFKGSLAMERPGEVLDPFFADMHEHAIDKGAGEIAVDLTDFEFTNSSGVKVLLNWIIRLNRSQDKYKISFLCSTEYPWQELALGQMVNFAPGYITVRNK